MIAILNILDNLISFSMLIIGYVLDNMIILLKNPFGFVAVLSSITFFEYSTAKSIVKDMRLFYIKKILKLKRKRKNREAKCVVLNNPQQMPINIIFDQKTVENIGAAT